MNMQHSWPGRFLHSCLTVLFVIGSVFVSLGPGVRPVRADPLQPLWSERAPVAAQQEVLVDDFTPQPLQGDSVYYYNRLGGDRGALNNSTLTQNPGEMSVTVAAGQAWGGLWTSLNHPDREAVGLNFSTVFPAQVRARYQSRITAIRVEISRGTAGRTLKLELKDGASVRWTRQAALTGSRQVLAYNLPALQKITDLIIVIDQASAGNQVVLDKISLTAVTELTDPLEAAFAWSYGMLLNNWNPTTGLVRDKATDASGEFDAIQCTGALAAATAAAAQLGVVSHADAVGIVNKISDTLLNQLPHHKELWPHWVKTGPPGKFSIVPGTEYSSVDTVIAALGLLGAQVALGLDPSGVIQFLKEIDWAALLTPDGISHGYTDAGVLIPYAWDSFGGESLLIDLAYAAVTHQVPPLKFPLPPTANGSGFIDEMAWLFVLPPAVPDAWEADWPAFRAEAVQTQISYYPTQYQDECLAELGLFGLSAAEVPDPSAVAKAQIYQAFGVGGRFSAANDGHPPLAGPVVTPHYAGMAAFLRPQEAEQMWSWLVAGPFSPLNNVESLLFPVGSSCGYTDMTWNHLIGSWNLALQTLGLSQLLAARAGKVYALWPPALTNQFLRDGYRVIFPEGIQETYLPAVLKK